MNSNNETVLEQSDSSQHWIRTCSWILFAACTLRSSSCFASSAENEAISNRRNPIQYQTTNTIHGITVRLRRGTQFQKTQALRKLQGMGSRAASITPLLLTLYLREQPKDVWSAGSPFRQEIRTTIATVGPAAIPAITRALNDPDVSKQAKLIELLIHMRKDSQLALNSCRKLLFSSADVGICSKLILLLSMMKTEQSSVCLAQYASQPQRNEVLRGYAIMELRHMNIGTDPVIQMIAQVACEDSKVGHEAIKLLAKINNSVSRKMLFHLILNTNVSDRSVSSAVSASTTLGKHRMEAVGFVTKACNARSAVVRKSAAAALGSLDGPLNKVLPVLTLLTLDHSPEVRMAALESIHSLNPNSPLVPRKLQQESCNPDWRARRSSILVLVRRIPDHRVTESVLLRTLDDYHNTVRLTAIAALWTLGPNAKYAVNKLTVTDFGAASEKGLKARTFRLCSGIAPTARSTQMFGQGNQNTCFLGV